MTNSSARITLAGGVTIHAQSMIMYDESLLQESATLLQETDKKLGASGGEVGFMGSPSFVLGALATASIFTRWQRARLGREAAELVEAANEKYRQALNVGREFDWGKIDNTDWSDPSRWQAIAFEDLKRKIFVPKPDGEMRVRTVDDRWIWIMWRHVTAYEPLSDVASGVE